MSGEIASPPSAPEAASGNTQSPRTARSDPERDFLLRMSRTLFYVGCLTIAGLVIRPLGGVTISDLTFGLSAAAAACSVCRPRMRANGAWTLAAILVVCGGVLATLRSVAPIENLTIAGRLVFILVVWPWQARVLLNTRERIGRALSLFVIGAAASAVAAVLQFRYGLNFGGGGVLNGRAVGLTAHANDQGGLLAIALCVALGQLVYGMATARVTVALAALCGVGLVLSGSVSGMLAALVGVAVLSLRKGISFSVLLAGGLMLCVGWIAASTLTVASSDGRPMTPLERLSQATGGGRADQNTVETRLETYRIAIAGIRQNPVIGTGLDELSGRTTLGLGAHNILLLAWFQGGLLVLVAEVLALTAAARRAWPRSTETDAVRETVIAAFAAGVAFAMTAPTLYNRYFWLPPVCLMVIDSLRRRPGEDPLGSSVLAQRSTFGASAKASRTVPS